MSRCHPLARFVRVIFVCCALLLTSCGTVEGPEASVLHTVEGVAETASGTLRAARTGVQSAVDAGKLVVDGVQTVGTDVTQRVGKLQRAAELIREAFGMGD